MKSNQDMNHEAPDSFTSLLREAVSNDTLPPADPALREAVLKRLDQPLVEPALSAEAASRRRTFFQRAGIALVSTAALAVAAVIWQQPLSHVVGLAEYQNRAPESNMGDRLTRAQPSPTSTQPPANLPRMRGNHGDDVDKLTEADHPSETAERLRFETRTAEGTTVTSRAIVAEVHAAASKEEINAYSGPQSTPSPEKKPAALARYGNEAGREKRLEQFESPPATGTVTSRTPVPGDRLQPSSKPEPLPSQPRPDSNFYQEAHLAKGIKESKSEDAQVNESRTKTRVVQSAEGGKAGDSAPQAKDGRDALQGVVALSEGIVNGNSEGQPVDEVTRGRQTFIKDEKALKELKDGEKREDSYFRYYAQPGGEQYAKIIENQFLNPNIRAYAESTFSIDVDTASYANVRRFLNNGTLPPPDAVRLEEMVNYFKYKYPQPKGDEPFSVNTEMADCPWQPGHKLLRVGLQGKEIHRAERPASNLVFLIDTSGSMTDQNKLPLLKDAFKMLVGELGENDKVTIVTYAGNAGLRLPPTRGHEKDTIIAAIDGMQSGGSTHGSAGIQLAYEIAAAQFIKDGTNKVILATDGDLNVGITDDAQLVELITKKAETGVFLTVLGVGTGNLKDAKMERLADNGNGIYAYLDSVREARKVLVEEMSGSLVTIAKDVKIQLEFNPAHVASYRLLGYENRVMANQDFTNDAKDAGEIGAGHSVTAMYEIVMAGAPDAKAPAAKPEGEPLRYQRVAPPEAPKKELTEAGKSDELLIVRLRYKKPEAKKEDAAKQVDYPLTDKGGSFNSASKEFQFASAVVAFSLSLRNSEFRGSTNLSAVAEMAQPALGEDNGGHRAEFLDLVRRAKSLRGE